MEGSVNFTSSTEYCVSPFKENSLCLESFTPEASWSSDIRDMSTFGLGFTDMESEASAAVLKERTDTATMRVKTTLAYAFFVSPLDLC